MNLFSIFCYYLEPHPSVHWFCFFCWPDLSVSSAISVCHFLISVIISSYVLLAACYIVSLRSLKLHISSLKSLLNHISMVITSWVFRATIFISKLGGVWYYFPIVTFVPRKCIFVCCMELEYSFIFSVR